MRDNSESGVEHVGRDALVAAGLFAGSFLLFAHSVFFEFIPLDDPFYVTENPWVRSGFQQGGPAWALASYQGGNWHPLTWLSLMADAAMSGGRPWAFHLSNVVFHGAAAAVLYLALQRLTRRRARSATVAALFAVHPLHVEAVAWVSERKEVLSALFGFIALAAYAGWVARPGRLRFAAVLAAYAASLAAKAMWVTLPLLLLVLDVWPLQRMARDGAGITAEALRRRIVEKWPLFAMSVAAAVTALVAQRSAGAVAGLQSLPPSFRVANAVTACAEYLIDAAWPSHLAVFYPAPAAGLSAAWVATAAAGLLVVTGLAVRRARRLPYFFAGWFWYLVTLLPVIGIVQVGLQIRADRYTYVPLVGIFLAAVWGVAELADRIRPVVASGTIRGIGVAALGAVTVASFCVVTLIQLERWSDGVTLFSHTVAVTGPNALARNCLGRALLERGNASEAAAQFAEAVRVSPEFTDARSNLAGTLVQLNRLDAAVAQYREALRVNPEHVLANANLGRILLARGDFETAAHHLSAAVKGRPGNADTRAALGGALLRLGRPQEAVVQLTEALRLDPARVDARVDLGFALAQTGDVPGAAREVRAALRVDPSNPAARGLRDSLNHLPGGPP